MKKYIILIICIIVMGLGILSLNLYKLKQSAYFLENKVQYEYDLVQNRLKSYLFNYQCILNTQYYKFYQLDTLDINNTLFLRMSDVCTDCFIKVFDHIRSLINNYSWNIVILSNKEDTWLNNSLMHIGYENIPIIYLNTDFKLPVDNTGLPYMFTINELNGTIENIFLINKDNPKLITIYFNMLQRWRIGVIEN